MLPRTLQKRRQIDAWELDELELETKTGREMSMMSMVSMRDLDDVDDVNDSDPTPPSVLQQACSPSHLVSFAQKGGGCI